MNYHCLIVDDEKMLADSTSEYFNLFGVQTAVVYGADACEHFLKEHSAELILLDINLGDGSGFDLCKRLRERTNIPILFLSARTSDDDKIIAMNIGGDDYIQKPYSLGVLLAKVKAVLKRYGQTDPAYSDGYAIKLTALEFKLLAYLIENRGKVISKKELFEKVWEDKFTGDGTLNVHIRRLREAIELTPRNPRYIVTAWGDGYLFKI